MSALLTENKMLPNNQVYKSGSAQGVNCANCNTNSTSGSWRKGWVLPDSNFANLCNRCGQRWVKLNRGLIKDINCFKFQDIPSHTSPQNPSPLFDDHRTPVRMDEESSIQTNKEIPDDACLMDVSNMDSYIHTQKKSKPIPGAPFNAYCMQKLVDDNSTYVLYWVIDHRGTFILAVVGIDVRGSGHFIYNQTPHLTPYVPALRCTNRNDVVAWLADALGVTIQKQEAASQIPLFTIPQIHALFSSKHTEEEQGEYDEAEEKKPVHIPQQLLSRHPDRCGKIRPYTNTKSLPRFKCSTCGAMDHETEKCQLNCLSPPALIQVSNQDVFMSIQDTSMDDFFKSIDGIDSPMQDIIFSSPCSDLDSSQIDASTTAMNYEPYSIMEQWKHL